MKYRLKYTLLCVCISAWLVSACGYHLPGRGDAIPADVEKIFVEVLVNRTAEPFIENRLTSEVRDQFARRPGFEVVSERSKADAVISGTITRYHASAVAYDEDDDIKEYRAAMTADFRFERTDGSEVLWQGNVSWDEEFMAHDDRAQQDNNETEAQEELTFRLATELFNRIVDNF
ncbi:MAG: LPS assembly lipoprotein LptE [Desulfuromonadaceae bacterium]|jgi:outer membrane lipopolysaccharide assembly protein LptE/RlpB